ncbi:NAD-dependent deacylase [Palleronia caenipelagi]|uniref:NAD-dependent protein deacylase n=1 Tax=Palleronia caenipelagi TaxID=2489174 RepID=A0A547Q5A7_9RHOB|nr:NAD-dependent deacylase [Palleronia caenipelagi]TRD21548.1 NAD-dependent deacylase [Palleronia caenipelagi]
MIFILTGAGLSAESGLGTFRDTGGIWSKYDLTEVATPEGYARNPARVHEFYNVRRRNAAAATPNPAHYALANLEKRGVARLITQNVDSLLEAAGASSVLHMHGQLDRVKCANCDVRWDAPLETSADDACPTCGALAVRPDVVWFGEIPYGLDQIETWLATASLFVAIGTSGTVYPAAGYVDMARTLGIPTLEINLEPSGGAFDDGVYGPASETVPNWVETLGTSPLR